MDENGFFRRDLRPIHQIWLESQPRVHAAHLRGGHPFQVLSLLSRRHAVSRRDPSPPALFRLGEKVPKADEGAFHEDVIRAPSSALGPASVNRSYLVTRPPSAFGTFSPHKKPWGEKGSRRREGKALEGTIQVSVCSSGRSRSMFGRSRSMSGRSRSMFGRSRSKSGR